MKKLAGNFFGHRPCAGLGTMIRICHVVLSHVLCCRPSDKKSDKKIKIIMHRRGVLYIYPCAPGRPTMSFKQ